MTVSGFRPLALRPALSDGLPFTVISCFCYYFTATEFQFALHFPFFMMIPSFFEIPP